MNAQWQLQEAKNRLSEVVREARTTGPQIITVRGHAAAVVVSVAEYRRLTRPHMSLTEFFRQSLLYAFDLDVERSADTGRDVVI